MTQTADSTQPSMTQTADSTQPTLAVEGDLASAAISVLAASPEPLTVSKIRGKLPRPFRAATIEELTDCLRRQAAAQVIFQFPRYRSQQDRYWDRDMPVHVAALIRETLQTGPLTKAEVCRKLPAYAMVHVDQALESLLTSGQLYRHPRGNKRGDRFGSSPPDCRDYLQPELGALLVRVAELGFELADVRAAALEILHNEEWSPGTQEVSPAAVTEPGAEASNPESAIRVDQTENPASDSVPM